MAVTRLTSAHLRAVTGISSIVLAVVVLLVAMSMRSDQDAAVQAISLDLDAVMQRPRMERVALPNGYCWRRSGEVRKAVYGSTGPRSSAAVRVGPGVVRVGFIDRFVVGRVDREEPGGQPAQSYFILDTARHRVIEGLGRDDLAAMAQKLNRNTRLDDHHGCRDLIKAPDL